jgi:hypothetical protein
VYASYSFLGCWRYVHVDNDCQDTVLAMGVCSCLCGAKSTFWAAFMLPRAALHTRIISISTFSACDKEGGGGGGPPPHQTSKPRLLMMHFCWPFAGRSPYIPLPNIKLPEAVDLEDMQIWDAVEAAVRETRGNMELFLMRPETWLAAHLGEVQVEAERRSMTAKLLRHFENSQGVILRRCVLASSSHFRPYPGAKCQSCLPATIIRSSQGSIPTAGWRSGCLTFLPLLNSHCTEW